MRAKGRVWHPYYPCPHGAAHPTSHTGIELVLNTRVASVRASAVSVVSKSGEEYEIPFGSCVWATGIAMNPLVKQLQALMPEQTHFR